MLTRQQAEQLLLGTGQDVVGSLADVGRRIGQSHPIVAGSLPSELRRPHVATGKAKTATAEATLKEIVKPVVGHTVDQLADIVFIDFLEYHRM